MLNSKFGGKVEGGKGDREDGQFCIDLDTNSELFKGLADKEEVLLTHGDAVSKLAEGFKATAHSGPIIAGTSCRGVTIGEHHQGFL